MRDIRKAASKRGGVERLHRPVYFPGISKVLPNISLQKMLWVVIDESVFPLNA